MTIADSVNKAIGLRIDCAPLPLDECLRVAEAVAGRYTTRVYREHAQLWIACRFADNSEVTFGFDND